MAERPDNLDQILQDCLDKIQSAEETLESVLVYYSQVGDELRPILEAALWMQSRKAALQPRPGFVGSSRRRLVEQIQQEQVASMAPPEITWWGKLSQFLVSLFAQNRYATQFVLAMVLVLALVAGSTGIAAASQDALPGDILYSIKRSIEKAELALTPDDAGKAELYIQHAHERLDEVQFLLEANRTEHVPETVALFEEFIYNAVSIMVSVNELDAERAKELATSLNATLSEESRVLREMAPSSPPAVRGDIDRILSVSEGMVVLVGDRIPFLAATLTPTPTRTSTVTPSLTASSTTKPTATNTLIPTQVVVEPPTVAASPTITFTATVTATVITEDEEPAPKLEKTKKPTKTPKPEKTKKSLPDPTRRPPRPDR